jgi:hypothetical protein
MTGDGNSLGTISRTGAPTVHNAALTGSKLPPRSRMLWAVTLASSAGQCPSSRVRIGAFCWQRERKLGVVVRDTTVEGGRKQQFFDLKVPRHCPLVLLIRVRLEFRAN